MNKLIVANHSTSVYSTPYLKPILFLLDRFSFHLIEERARKRGRPRVYTDAQILKIELVKRFDKNLRHTRSIARCLKWDKDLREACGLKTRTPHFSTISRRRRKLQVKILVLISHEILKYLISLGAVASKILSIDSSDLEQDPRFDRSARWGKNGDGAWVYGYKVHQVVDCLSQITVALKVTFISRHDSKEAVPLMKRVRSLGKKVLYWLGDGAYDCEKIYGDAAQNGERLIAALNRRRSKKILAKTPLRREGITFLKTSLGKHLYRKRVEAEHAHSNLKEYLGLSELKERYIRGLEEVEKHVHLCWLAMLLAAAYNAKIGRRPARIKTLLA